MISPKSAPIWRWRRAKRRMIAARTSGRDRVLPVSRCSEVAMSATSAGKSVGVDVEADADDDEIRTGFHQDAGHFRRPIQTSLGHLMPVAVPNDSTASATASPAASARRGHRACGSSGRMRMENASDSPGLENHVAPRRPRPAVCSMASRTSPPGVPASARARSSSLVEAAVSRTSRRKGSGKSGGDSVEILGHVKAG